MRSQARSFAWVAGSIVLCTLLVACGHTDPDTRTSATPGGSVGAISAHGGEGANATGDGGSPDQGNPSNAGDSSGDTQDHESSTEDTDDSTTDSTEPNVPDGTLTYTVVFSGHSELDTSEKHNVFDISRRLQVTSRLRGTAIISRASDTFAGKMQACGDDSACQQAVVTSLMSQGRSALEQRMRALGRDRMWSRLDGPCHGTASVDDKGDNHWKGWDTKLNGRVSQQGTTTFDCRHVQLGMDFSGLKLAAQADTHTYTLTLPRFQMEARYVFGDKAPTTRLVDFPGLTIRNVKFTTLDRPLHGSATLHNDDGNGKTLGNPGEPLTARVDWTFTPDAR